MDGFGHGGDDGFDGDGAIEAVAGDKRTRLALLLLLIVIFLAFNLVLE